MRKRFLAIATIPPSWDREELVRRLERVARSSSDLGVHPLETFYSLPRRKAYTLVDAADEDAVRSVHQAAGFDAEVVPGERIHTDLLDEPHRAR